MCRKAKTNSSLVSDAIRLVRPVGAVLRPVAELSEADARQVRHAEQFALRALGVERRRSVGAERGILGDLREFIVTVSLCTKQIVNLVQTRRSFICFSYPPGSRARPSRRCSRYFGRKPYKHLHNQLV